jgi:hypothetical protein
MAACRLRDICFDCTDHYRIAHFWAEVLGYTIRPATPEATQDDAIALDPTQGGLRLWFNKVPEPKVVKNRARVLQEIRDASGQLRWTIMADPEGHEFCAFPPRE